MRPLDAMPVETAASIHTVMADIDDTLTTDGSLPAKAYSALERLKAAGFRVAAITGRPAGWCDMIARFWPVDGVVGENGALYYAYDRGARKMIRVFATSDSVRRHNQIRYEKIAERILKEVPGSAVSADQSFREADLAIDFCEDVTPLHQQDVERIKAIFEDEGAVAKVSSIHVNGWYGAYDKLTMTRRFTSDVLGVDLDTEKDRIVFCGDSPNDAPMFGYFPNACGVANVLDFKGRIEAEPGWIASERGGAGFAELADVLIAAKKISDRRISA
ncbi:HAD-IIB family hydrolase [uncultured Roseibium sp.]|uniref:HAD-IIB family hydrolase n=1 Tax=uncultured Roseibium sp. TaxID=1936171 RepID=UPI0026318758|nr:HAD-IIB family hydrolase [uncultured Roseibium sp.]